MLEPIEVRAIDLAYLLDHVADLEEYKTEIEGLFEAEIIS